MEYKFLLNVFVKTQTPKSKELTKMVTTVDGKCYQTSAGAKVKGLMN